MGTITTRKRKDGSLAYMARVRVMQGNDVLHKETQTFDREAAAKLWIKQREVELGEPGALEALKAPDPAFAEVIERYVTENLRKIGKTKAQVLRTVGRAPIAQQRCSQITSSDWVTYARSLNVQPSTVSNYLSHIAAIYAVARPAWGYKLDYTAIVDAQTVCKTLGVVKRARSRDRRPTLDELERIFRHFERMKHPKALPMREIALYAIFSTRRQDEITRQTFEDLDESHSEIWVRDMKHPGEKEGNDVRCKLPPEALALILSRRRASGQEKGRIFPYNSGSVSTAWTRACAFLGIEDLHFHDLRHDGVSRLFELGWTIPRVSTVSGHRTWNTLKRYTHIRQTGDKYAEWSKQLLTQHEAAPSL